MYGIGKSSVARAQNRRVEIVEGEALHAIGDLPSDAAEGPPFVRDDAAVCLADARDDRVFVERAQGSQIDYLRLDPFLRERFGGFERDAHHAAPRDDRDVLPLTRDPLSDARTARADPDRPTRRRARQRCRASRSP